MELPRVVKIGLCVDEYLLKSKELLFAYLSHKTTVNGRILLTFRDYLVHFSNKFDDVILHFSSDPVLLLFNGTFTGIIGEVNLSEIDISVGSTLMIKDSLEAVDFIYPFRMSSRTFVIKQPEYKPEIFGIFQTFSLLVWITIMLVFIAIVFVYYIALTSKYQVSKILLHVVAVLLRQNSIFKSVSLAENFFVYSWVFGAMFLCLAYDSVFLSFLAFPPVISIKRLSDLAASVKNGEYHCISHPDDVLGTLLGRSNDKYLRIIGTNILTNNISYDIYDDFIYEKTELKLALLVYVEHVDLVNVGKKFVSEDHFLPIMAAMIVRKDFCCKNLLDTFVHRMMASGLYYKIRDDLKFIRRYRQNLKFQEKDKSKRKLTLTDLAPAFMFLIVGYFASCIFFMREVLSVHV